MRKALRFYSQQPSLHQPRLANLHRAAGPKRLFACGLVADWPSLAGHRGHQATTYGE
jgi:hypothetical protein